MKIKFQKSFTIKFIKLPSYQKRLVKDALELFDENTMHEDLRNHPLKDRWSGYRSITVDDNLRLHYRTIDKDIALFVAVGTHNELYKQ
ncbi:MAG: type II toxin-antitoxin system RelE/ParE family toxin [Candidatus Saccharimonadales bacterium]